MKPCRRHRKRLAFLALDALDQGEARELRAHLEICSGCDQYLQQMVNVRDRVRATETETDIETPASFHGEIVAALRMQAATPETLVTVLQRFFLNWRLGVPVGFATLIFAAILLLRPHQSPLPNAGSGPEIAGLDLQRDLEPTVSNYMAVANRSFEQFDDLLTRQGNKRSAHLPVFTARGVLDSGVSD